MRKTDAQNQKAYRDRQRAKNPPLQCGHCGRPLKGKLSKARLCCSTCWPTTTEGKADTARRVREHQQRQQEKSA